MAVKFGRDYQLSIQSTSGKFAGQTITIQRPFTVEFDIFRTNFGSSNTASIRIYNLNPDSRAQIRKDQQDASNLKRVLFKAGYQTDLSTLLSGNVIQAWSVREGVNFITEVLAYDAGYAYVNATTNISVVAGQSLQSVITSLVSSLSNFGVSIGAIGQYPGFFGRACSLTGMTTDILRELTGGGFYIDNGKAYCFHDNECAAGDIATISAESGLLGTPTREYLLVNLEMLLEPKLYIGQLVKVNTSTGQDFNTIYKVISLRHKGMISDAVCGSATTNVGLISGNFTPISVVT